MKAFKYRCYLTSDQKLLLERTFGCCRFVYNQCLEQANKEYAEFTEGKTTVKPKVSGVDFCNRLPKLKEQYPFLKEVSAVALQQSLLHLGKAFKSFFKGTGYPKFKSRHRNRACMHVTGMTSLRVKGRKVWIPKSSDYLKVAWERRYLPSEPSSYSIERTPDGKYWISFLCKEYVPQLTNGSGVVGIDLGLTTLATDSNGVKYDNPKYYVNAQKRLAKAQRRLARRKRGSVRRHKAKLAVARIHAKIANQRKDWIHKLTRTLVNENQVIGIENLRVPNLVRNRKLAKGILDAGWGLFRHCLTYKAVESAHSSVVVIDAFEPSTQCCSNCGGIRAVKLELKQRHWTCPNCGTEHDRDVNAANNIRLVAEYCWRTVGGSGQCIYAPPLLRELNFTPASPGCAQSISSQ